MEKKGLCEYFDITRDWPVGQILFDLDLDLDLEPEIRMKIRILNKPTAEEGKLKRRTNKENKENKTLLLYSFLSFFLALDRFPKYLIFPSKF